MMERNYKTVYETAVKDYLSELKHKDMSDKTIHSYNNPIKYFKEFKSATSGWETVPDVSDVRAWRDSLLDNGTSKKTVCYYLGVLRTFFEFASDIELGDDRYFECNPVLKKIYPVIKKSEETKPYTKVLDADDLKKLWENIRIPYSDKFWARNYAIVTLLLDGKIRNAELLDLRLNDIHFADEEEPFNYLVVNNGKGNKYREVDLTEISVSALKLYLKSGIRPDDVSDDDYLFGTTAEKKLRGLNSGAAQWHKGSSQWVSGIVERHVKKATGKAGFRTHSMRHNGAIMELNSGASMEQIQSELGHSSVSTTHIYAGRLQSKRNRMNMADVYAVRDEWAERNNAMMEGA